MQYYFSLIAQGIATGSVYGLVGLSMVFIYRSTRVINFAQGEMGSAAAFICGALLHILPAWVAVLAALAAVFFLGVLFEVAVMRRLKDKHDALVVTIGLYAVLNSVCTWQFGSEPMPFPSPIAEGSVDFHGVIVSYQSIFLLACTLTLSLLLMLLFKFTLVGFAFQAVSEDEVAAELKGIRVGALVAMSWGISAVIGGVASMLIAHSSFLYPQLMGPPLLYAFAGAVVGGLQTSFGPLAGGILIGVVENLAGNAQVIGPQLKVLVVAAVLIFFLMVKPRGLFGRDEARKI